MTFETAFVFALLIATFVAMVDGRVPPDVIALVAMGTLLVGGILDPADAFGVFSNEATITVGCMFILSAALDRTGALDKLGAATDQLVGNSEWTIICVLFPIVASASAFVNNTPVVLLFIPIVTRIAAKRNIKPSKLLIPLSFASILGGCCTLIGTSTNLLVSSTASALGNQGLHMFDLAPVGCIIALFGMIFLLTIGRYLLPARDTLSAILQTTESKHYSTEVVILKDSPLVGKSLPQTPLKDLNNVRILEVVRYQETLPLGLDEIVFEAGDRLRLSVLPSSIMEVKNLKGIEILQQPEDIGLALIETEKTVIVEGVVSPQSRLEGQTVRQLDLRRRFGIRILALHRRGVNLGKFQNARLRFGDMLLIEGSESSIKRFQESRSIMLLSADPIRTPLRSKQPYAIGAISGMVLLAVTTSIPISVLAILASILAIVTGCLKNESIYQAIDWRILFMIFGMLSLGVALEKTGGVQLIADSMLNWTGGLDTSGTWGKAIVLSAIILICSLLTTFLSNSAVAVMITPIVLQIANSLQMAEMPLLLGVAIGCSACFATPIGYQTNTLVYSAGGYQFRDFLKIGIPLNLLVWIVASLFIPLLYPLSAP